MTAITAERVTTCKSCGGEVTGPDGRVHLNSADRDRCQQIREAVANRVDGKTIARAAKISPRTKRVEIRDEYGFVASNGNRRYATVLAILARTDLTPDLSARIHTVAYALRKCMVSARMPAESENRIATYSPYRICALVARIADECPETTIGGICDTWLLANHKSL
jgi:hypothetical protein